MMRVRGGALFALLLAGCATAPVSGTVAPADTGMGGRWILAAPNAPTCGMNFSGPPGAHEGRVAPEGGCPGNFFMSRRWSLVSGTLTIVDQNNQPLATLSNADGRFEGTSATGLPVTLTPPTPPPG